MFINNKISGYDSTQMYYPVGPDKDSYSLSTWFDHDVTTGQTTIHCEAVINWPSNPPRRRTLVAGTPTECIAAIEAAVEPFRKHMELDRIRKKAEYEKVTTSDTYKLTDAERIILEMGDAYLEPDIMAGCAPTDLIMHTLPQTSEEVGREEKLLITQAEAKLAIATARSIRIQKEQEFDSQQMAKSIDQAIGGADNAYQAAAKWATEMGHTTGPQR